MSSAEYEALLQTEQACHAINAVPELCDELHQQVAGRLGLVVLDSLLLAWPTRELVRGELLGLRGDAWWRWVDRATHRREGDAR